MESKKALKKLKVENLKNYGLMKIILNDKDTTNIFVC